MSEKKTGLDIASLIVKIALLSILLGFVLTLFTLLIPITVPTAMDVDDMRFGKPFPYLLQSFSGVPNEEFFPARCIPKFTERYSTEIDMGAFVASFAVNSVIAAVLIVAVRYLKKRKSDRQAASPEMEVTDGFARVDGGKDLT